MHSLKAKTQRGRPTWNLRALRDIVRSDVYLGIASHGEFRKEDAHESLIDLGTWRRAQRNGVQTVSRSATPGLLTGLLRCAGCRYALTARTHRLKDDRVVHDYRCRCQSELAGSCPEPASASGAEGVHEWVVERFFERIEDVQVAAVSDDRVGDLQDARDRARDALNAYASDARIQATIGMDAYVTALQTRQEALETAQTALDAEQDSIDALSTTADAPRCARTGRISPFSSNAGYSLSRSTVSSCDGATAPATGLGSHSRNAPTSAGVARLQSFRARDAGTSRPVRSCTRTNRWPGWRSRRIAM